MKKNNLDSWKQLDKDLLDPIAEKLGDFVDFITPERKDRSEANRKPSAEEEEDAYFKERNKIRKARYEALKEKYKD